MQRQLYSYGETVRSQRERAHDAIQQTESALHACLADNNRIRRKFGLEPVTLTAFIAHASSVSLNLNELNKAGSITSSMRDDVFYDAEEGGDSDEDDSESDSMHEAEEAFSSDDEDDEDDDASVDSSPGEKGWRDGSSATPANVGDKKVEAVKSQLSPVPVGPVQPSRPIIRRNRLPAPTVSMQNISIMSILRNNVSLYYA